MPSSSNSPFDLSVLDMIDHSPIGSVPHTPTFDEAIVRLRATQQVFPSADHKDGHVTARALAQLPLFYAANIQAFASSPEGSVVLESNISIFDRYIASLSATQRPQAEKFRLPVAGHPIHHRHRTDGTTVIDPLNTIFLIPGAGPKPGLPGNYLHGVLAEKQDSSKGRTWSIQVLDSDNDAAILHASSSGEAFSKLQELIESAPFHLTELDALGFTLR